MMHIVRRQGGIVREEAAEILALHNGDALEALRTLIAERDAVEERLAVATLVMRRQCEAGGRPGG